MKVDPLRERVRILSPSRLHFGLIDESGCSGRVDGGTGLSLYEPYWDVEVQRKGGLIRGKDLSREHRKAIGFALKSLSHMLPGERPGVTVHRCVPPHIGLGSKTSLLLAIGRAICFLADSCMTAVDLATILGRGGTSGIGIHSVNRGGFIWDAGHKFPEEKPEFGPSSQTLAKPAEVILARSVDWVDIVHFRFSEIGVNGQEERSVFKKECPIPACESNESLLCVSSLIAPAIVEKDECLLQTGLGRLQRTGFKKREWLHQDVITTRFKRYWDSLGVSEALGLSSFGPTLYVLTKRPQEIQRLVEGFDATLVHLTHTRVNNRGVTILSTGEEHHGWDQKARSLRCRH